MSAASKYDFQVGDVVELVEKFSYYRIGDRFKIQGVSPSQPPERGMAMADYCGHPSRNETIFFHRLKKVDDRTFALEMVCDRYIHALLYPTKNGSYLLSRVVENLAGIPESSEAAFRREVISQFGRCHHSTPPQRFTWDTHPVLKTAFEKMVDGQGGFASGDVVELVETYRTMKAGTKFRVKYFEPSCCGGKDLLRVSKIDDPESEDSIFISRFKKVETAEEQPKPAEPPPTRPIQVGDHVRVTSDLTATRYAHHPSEDRFIRPGDILHVIKIEDGSVVFRCPGQRNVNFGENTQAIRLSLVELVDDAATPTPLVNKTDKITLTTPDDTEIVREFALKTEDDREQIMVGDKVVVTKNSPARHPIEDRNIRIGDVLEVVGMNEHWCAFRCPGKESASFGKDTQVIANRFVKVMSREFSVTVPDNPTPISPAWKTGAAVYALAVAGGLVAWYLS